MVRTSDVMGVVDVVGGGEIREYVDSLFHTTYVPGRVLLVTGGTPCVGHTRVRCGDVRRVSYIHDDDNALSHI